MEGEYAVDRGKVSVMVIFCRLMMAAAGRHCTKNRLAADSPGAYVDD